MKRLSLYGFILAIVFMNVNLAFSKDTIIVSIAPQAYFLEKIVDSTVNVVTFLPRGADPHSFEPSAKLLKELSKASIFFTIGIGLEEQWEQRLHSVAPKMQFIPSYVQVPTPYALKPQDAHMPQTLEYIREEDKTMHDHNHHASEKPFFKENQDGNFVPVNQHVWTSPQIMRAVVEQMLTKLVQLYPQHAKRYMENANRLTEAIDAVDVSIRKTLEQKQYRSFLSYHPTWKYFATEYNLVELVVEQNEREPSAKDIVSIVKKAKQEHISVFITQPQFSKKVPQTIAKELGNIPIISIDALQKDWFLMMKQIETTLQKYLR